MLQCPCETQRPTVPWGASCLENPNAFLNFKKKLILRFFAKDPKLDFECKEYIPRMDSLDQVLILRIHDDYESFNGLYSYGPQK